MTYPSRGDRCAGADLLVFKRTSLEVERTSSLGGGAGAGTVVGMELRAPSQHKSTRAAKAMARQPAVQ